jgi:hypothetical protein
MAFVSRIRLRFRSGTGQYLERFYADTFVPGRQALFARGELLSMALLRIEVPGDQAETYDLVSYWANKAAHDRDEDSPLDLLSVTTLGGYLATPGHEVRRSRRRLYLQRWAVWALVSVVVALLYVGSIVGLQAVVVRVTGQSSAVVLVGTTLVFAALLQAVRGRLQALVDRHFFRSRYVAAQAVAAFGELARSALDEAQLADELLAAVTKTVQPEFAFVWVLAPQGMVQEVGQTRVVQPVVPTGRTVRAAAAGTPASG